MTVATATTGSTKPARSSNTAFVTHFMPGLIVGLLIGGLAGAFLPPMLEGQAVNVQPAKTGLSPNTPRHEREDSTPVTETNPTNSANAGATDPSSTNTPEQTPTNAETKPKPTEPQPANPK